MKERRTISNRMNQFQRVQKWIDERWVVTASTENELVNQKHAAVFGIGTPNSSYAVINFFPEPR
jgi:hypothetical protein